MNTFGILSCSLHNYKFLLQLDNSKHTWHLERSFRYNLLENLFKTYMTTLKTSPQSEIGKLHLLIMVLTISLRVRLRLSATLFYSGLLIMVCWETMPQFSKYLAKWPLKLSIWPMLAIILTISIRPYNFDNLFTLFFNFSLENLKLLKCIRFIWYEIHVPIAWKIINKRWQNIYSYIK